MCTKKDLIFIGVALSLCIWIGFLRFALYDVGGYARTFGNMALEFQQKYYAVQKQLIDCLRNNETLDLQYERRRQLVTSATVTVTCYNSHPSQTDSTPEITAFNTKTGPGTVAVSRDLLDRGFIPFSKVWVEGFGIFTVNDIMNKRYENRIDIWIGDKAKVFKKEDVRIIGFCDCSNKSDI